MIQIKKSNKKLHFLALQLFGLDFPSIYVL
jgi:hypothetical protein